MVTGKMIFGRSEKVGPGLSGLHKKFNFRYVGDEFLGEWNVSWILNQSRPNIPVTSNTVVF